MNAPPTHEEIARDARWLLQALDPPKGLARLVAMTPDDYRAASFLDDRLVQAQAGPVVAWDAVAGAVTSDMRRDARWIFHIGHVGSTLIARILGELGAVLSVREPRALRDLLVANEAQRQAMMPVIQALYARTFAPSQAALVKATSFVSEIAAELAGGNGRALCLYACPRAYIEGILAGENSTRELQMLAPVRAQRMAERLPAAPPPRHTADLAALAWACEMTSLEQAAERMVTPPRWADFDAILATPETSLAGIAAFFGFAAAGAELRVILAGPLMNRYSKALEYEYSPALRRDLLAEAGRHFRREIDAALAMLGHAAETSPLLARALARAQPE